MRVCFWLVFYALGLGLLLPACQQLRRLSGARYHRISATALAHAYLVGGTEIDTGRYLLLAYERYSDRPHHSDNWFAENVYIRVRRLDALPIGREVAIPQPGIFVSTYAQATWYFEVSQAISGTITRLASTARGQRLRLNLRYIDRKGQSKILLANTVFFRNDPTYFQRHYIDHHGKYNDLRQALKEPARVRSLDLVTYAIDYEHRNGRGSGPDTLYRRLGELRNLEELNLHLSDLAALPPGFEKLKRLKKLNLGSNHLTTFPVQLLALDSLRELSLEYNQLDSIPASILGLKQLKVLNLGTNHLTHYPMVVNELTGLQELSLSNANLRTIPRQIQQLTELRVLNLDGFWNNPRRNQLRDISALKVLKQLRSLSLRDNGTIALLTDELYQLKGLEELDLQYNAIDTARVNKRRFPQVKKLLP